jgi:ubiquinone/menaquinone biosynthesis C-methylase UbiE
VLELACGTGLLTVPIAKRGLQTIGLDQSRAMLDAAKRRASADDVPVTFLQGDMLISPCAATSI